MADAIARGGGIRCGCQVQDGFVDRADEKLGDGLDLGVGRRRTAQTGDDERKEVGRVDVAPALPAQHVRSVDQDDPEGRLVEAARDEVARARDE
jgi:hypothetical protein